MAMDIERCRILVGDCRAVLPTIEPQSVQTCVTSPPYYGLRDYGTGQWEGGDAECDHKKLSLEVIERSNATSTLERSAGLKTNSHAQEGFKDTCGRCGARRIDSQLGLESTPEEYIANMVAVFREVWRVLRDDGTLFLNLGDSYAGTGNGDNKSGLAAAKEREDGCKRNPENWSSVRGDMHNFNRPKRTGLGLKPKDLCMMPARVALALQADGWYLRSEIVWHKPNPMPESVTDRPTKAHEMIYLLAKAERYFYDAEAIKELGEKPSGLVSCKSHCYQTENSNPSGGGFRGLGGLAGKIDNGFRNKRSVWTIATQPMSDYGYDFAAADYVDVHGIPRKWSADCPMHERDGQPRRESLVMAACDALPDSDLSHIGCNDENHAQAQVDAAVAKGDYKRNQVEDSFSCAPIGGTCENKKFSDFRQDEHEIPTGTTRTQSQSVPSMTDSGYPSCARTAISHNTGDRKNDRAVRKLGDDNVSEQLEFRIEYMEPRLYVTGRDESIGGNNTKPCNGHQKSTVEIVSHRNDKSSRKEGKCLCSISQVSHFATFPEEIPKLCILAGSKLGDTILDPFAGSGTVGQVALELGRKAILIELNPAYIELAQARTFVTPGFL
jgi:DNA modification methylase